MYQARVYYNLTDSYHLYCDYENSEYYGEYYNTEQMIILGLSLGILYGIILCCLCTCCICNCIGMICYKLISPGKFDSYHISNEINMDKIMKGKGNKVTPQ